MTGKHRSSEQLYERKRILCCVSGKIGKAIIARSTKGRLGVNMIKTKNISEMLTSLIEEYRFNKNTLSKYLEITEVTPATP